MARDLALIIGDFAQHVENRSLLLDKFVFHKQWPPRLDYVGNEMKSDESSRWSLMRITEGGDRVLHHEAEQKIKQSTKKQHEPEKAERLLAEAEIARSLARVRWDSREMEELRSKHTRNFVGLFRRAYGPDKSTVVIGQLEGRLAINLADSLIQNAGICLDRIFGLPYIPGSAVKGVCRHAALDALMAASDAEKPGLLEQFCSIFGTSENDFKNGELKTFRAHLQGASQDRKGAVCFLPAYPVNSARIVVDLTNVHYPNYYQSGRIEDLSRETPRPNPFPAVEIGAQFAFCLVLNSMSSDSSLLETARQWLIEALTVRGLGAKTASGYGWFSIQTEVLEQIQQQQVKEQQAAQKAQAEAIKRAAEEKAESERQASLSDEERCAEELLKKSDQDFAEIAKDLASKDPLTQGAFLHLLMNNKEKRERWKTWKKRKPDLVNSILKVAQTLNIQLP